MGCTTVWLQPERIGIVVGSGIGEILGIEEQTEKYLAGGARRILPFYVLSTIINMLPGQISILDGIEGPNFYAVSACATANHLIGTAMLMIPYADADTMIAGGAERGSSPPARRLQIVVRIDFRVGVGVDPRYHQQSYLCGMMIQGCLHLQTTCLPYSVWTYQKEEMLGQSCTPSRSMDIPQETMCAAVFCTVTSDCREDWLC